MTRTYYENAAKKMHWLITAWTFVFIGPVILLSYAMGSSIQSFGQVIRSQFGEIPGVVIAGLLLGMPPLLGWFAIAVLLDRLFGIRCPHCQRSLTARCLPGHILETGKCSHCHGEVFDENAGSETGYKKNSAELGLLRAVARADTIWFWGGVAVLAALSTWAIMEWSFMISQLSIPLDYFLPLVQARRRAAVACNLLLVVLPFVAIAFFRLRARFSLPQRLVAVAGQGLAIAIILLYVTTPRFRHW